MTSSEPTKININKERNVGIEILRIISMFMVVILHCLGHGGILDNAERGTVTYMVAWLVEICCYGAVDIYALITGYVCINTKTKFSRISQLWLQAVIYTAGITFIFKFFVPGQEIGYGQLLQSCLPLTTRHYWYLTAYFCLYLFIPFINVLLNNLTVIKRLYFSVLIFVVFAFVPFFCVFVGPEIVELNFGYSVFWLMLLYVVGATLKLNERQCKKVNKYFYLFMYFACSLLVLISKYVIDFVNNLFGRTVLGEDLFVSYHSPLIVLAAIGLLMFFKQVNIKHCKKFILAVSSASFGVYLISEQHLIKEMFMVDKLIDYAEKPWYLMLTAVVVYAVIVFVVCAIIDYIRIQIFKFIRIDKLLLIIQRKVEKVTDKIRDKVSLRITE